MWRRSINSRELSLMNEIGGESDYSFLILFFLQPNSVTKSIYYRTWLKHFISNFPISLNIFYGSPSQWNHILCVHLLESGEESLWWTRQLIMRLIVTLANRQAKSNISFSLVYYLLLLLKLYVNQKQQKFKRKKRGPKHSRNDRMLVNSQ